jgi:signal transduction histidine kinase
MVASIAEGRNPSRRGQTRDLVHLRKAEREVAALRWCGMVVWALILWRDDLGVETRWAWTVFAGGMVYATLAHWRLVHASSIGLSARLTSIGDPVLAALMCAVTGGLGSLFYPFFYFTLLAAAFRFGWRDAVAIFALNTFLSVLLYLFVPVPGIRLSDLFIGIFYLAFSTGLGVMLARWAQQNLDLAQARERAFRLARDRVRTLLRRLIHVQEEERRLVAGDMHDRLGHHIFMLQQGLSHLNDMPDMTDEMRATVKGIGRDVQACSNDIRMMINDLRPTVLDDLGFCEALREYAAQMSDEVPFELRLEIEDGVSAGHADAEAMLFRIVQEALLNVRKHANARHVEIAFRRGDNGRGVLTIEDDGEGFDPDTTEPGHFGLLTMRERAEALGGALDVSSVLGGGTKVTVRLATKVAA